MYIVQLIYRTIFNFYVKQDGYSKMHPFAATMSLLAVLCCLVVDVILILRIIFDASIGFHIPKAILYFGILIGCAIFYYFLFYILKWEKEGDTDDHLFPLEPKEFRKGITIILAIVLGACVLAAIDIIQQQINEQ